MPADSSSEVPLMPEATLSGESLSLFDRAMKWIGMSEQESKPLKDYLNQHAVTPEFVYRHRWQLHDLLMWDNRASMHYAVQDYDRGQLRRMQDPAGQGDCRHDCGKSGDEPASHAQFTRGRHLMRHEEIEF